MWSDTSTAELDGDSLNVTIDDEAGVADVTEETE